MSGGRTNYGALAGADLSRPVAELATEYDVSKSAVHRARRRAKRGPVGVVVRSDGIRWNALAGADLSAGSIAELAERYGVTERAVTRARKRRGASKVAATPAPVVATKPRTRAAPKPRPVVVPPPEPATVGTRWTVEQVRAELRHEPACIVAVRARWALVDVDLLADDAAPSRAPRRLFFGGGA